MAIASRPKPASHIKKRQAGHHRQGKHYLKAYWPYLPMLMTVAIGLMINSLWGNHQHVLGTTSNFTASSLLQSTNNFRIKANQPALALNAQLSAAAQAKANDMVNQNYWGHLSPSGHAPWDFITTAGYNYQLAGENLAYGFSDASATITGWMNSPEHRANILNPNYQEVGFGVASMAEYLGKGPAIIVVAEYAQPLSANQGLLGSSRTNNNLASSSIARIQLLTGGHAIWSAIALSAVAGAAFALFIARHGLKLRRTLKRGESYVVSHPLFDIIIVIVITAGYVLTRSSGVIR